MASRKKSTKSEEIVAKTEVPVEEIEDRPTDGDTADKGIVTQPADDGQVDHPQQRDRDVGDDIGNRQSENFSIHLRKSFIFTTA